MSILLASASFFASPAALAGECAWVLKDGLKGEARTTMLFKQQVDYTYFEPQNGYRIAKDLPNYQYSLLIHINEDGHAMLWYKGKRIDSEGVPFQEIISEVAPSQALLPGLVFVINNLPKDFVNNPFETMKSIENMRSATCVSAACKSLQRIGVLDPNKSPSVRATTFVKFLMTLDSKAKEELGLEVVGLGVTPESQYKQIARAELARAPQVAMMGIITGTALIAPLYILFDVFIK